MAMVLVQTITAVGESIGGYGKGKIKMGGLGRACQCDIGKRVYRCSKNHDWYMENNEQLAKRLAGQKRFDNLPG